MKEKLIALDMDGTLLTSDKKIPEANKEAIKKAQSAGHQVMICSGRPHGSLITYLEEEGLGDLPISASNGSVTLVDEKIIHIASMDHVKAHQVVSWLNEKQYPFNIYTDHGVFCPPTILDRAKLALQTVPPIHMNIEMLEIYLANNDVSFFESWDDLPKELEIFKIYVFTPHPDQKIAFENYAHCLQGLTVTSSFQDNVEISDREGHKGTGLKAIADHYNIPMNDTVAIGDNFNDEGMLKVAGLAIAMGNAEESIKKMCHAVTLTNDELGVAHAIETYVLGNTII